MYSDWKFLILQTRLKHHRRIGTPEEEKEDMMMSVTEMPRVDVVPWPMQCEHEVGVEGDVFSRLLTITCNLHVIKIRLFTWSKFMCIRLSMLFAFNLFVR